MVFVIATRYEHFRNWLNEQKLTHRHATPITSIRDVHKIMGCKPSGYVMLTPMEKPRDEEKLFEVMKRLQFYPLSYHCNDWPLTEFPFEERK